MPTENPPRGRSRWLCVTSGRNGGQRFVFVASGRYPDGMRVELPAAVAAAQIADDAVVEVELSAAAAVTTLRVSPAFAPKAPPMWFAELRERAARPPAVNLIAFPAVHGGTQPPDTLVDAADLNNVPVSSGDQLAALRWWPGTGEVDQVYVQPQHRRRSIGTVLVLAGSALSMARDWPRLWGDGQRTELGEQWRNAAAWRHRTDEQTHLAPPMTPGS